MSIESMGWDVIITAHAEYYLGESKENDKKPRLLKSNFMIPELGPVGR